LTEDAIWPAHPIVRLLPEDPEAKGLLVTMLYSKSREPSRRTESGAYVPLSMQDTALWDRAGLAEAGATLSSAARLGRIGPFQLEAAIQSAHVHARLTGRDDPRPSSCSTTGSCSSHRREACAAYDRAIGLSEDPEVRRFLAERKRALVKR
jgi:predicted RNA polymerase sigma factor